MLEVAKCIATDPQLILLDEVMAGLTLAEARAPIEIIKELRADGMTFLMVEHVIPVVMNLADRMVVLNFGEKIANSIPTEVVRDQQVRDAYFGDEAIDA